MADLSGATARPPTGSRSPGRVLSPTASARMPRAWTSTADSSMSGSPLASSRCQPCTTGTCRRHCKTGTAGGSRRRRRRPSATTPVTSPGRPPTASGLLHDQRVQRHPAIGQADPTAQFGTRAAVHQRAGLRPSTAYRTGWLVGIRGLSARRKASRLIRHPDRHRYCDGRARGGVRVGGGRR